MGCGAQVRGLTLAREVPQVYLGRGAAAGRPGVSFWRFFGKVLCKLAEVKCDF